MVYSLRVIISEAKDFTSPSYHDTADILSYAILNVESNKKHTRTVKGSNPLWAEEYNLQVLNPKLSDLKVTIWSEGHHKDKMIAYCDIPLSRYENNNNQIEEWFDLFVGRSSDYVSGEIRVRADYNIDDDDNYIFNITIIEGRNLPIRSKQPHEFFVKFNFMKQSFRTKAFKVNDSSSHPEWNESFQLKISRRIIDNIINHSNKKLLDLQDTLIHFNIYRSKLTRHKFIGYCSLNVDEIIKTPFFEKWILLQMNNNNSLQINEVKKSNSLSIKEKKKNGMIRLSLHLTKSIVYPIEYYTPLMNLLMDHESDNASGTVSVLESTVDASTDRDGLAKCLVRIYESKNKAPMMLKILLTNEISNSQNVETLFRANSLASKSVEMYMILSSFNYLHYCVKDTIDILYKDSPKGKSCEIDSSKVEKGEDVKKNWKYTQKILDNLLSKIYSSVDQCPSYLRDIFEHIQTEVEKKYPDHKTVKYTGVSAFLFLRFICPAILGPKLFDMAYDHPSPKISANVTQIAKILQRIANMSPTEDLEDPVLNEREKFVELNKQTMKKFLNKISRQSTNSSSFNPVSVDVQKECAYLQEHCERNIEKIIEMYEEKMNTRARDLLITLDKMNDDYGKKRSHALIKNENGEWIKNPDFKPLDNFLFDIESDSLESSKRNDDEESSSSVIYDQLPNSGRLLYGRRESDTNDEWRKRSKDDLHVKKERRRGGLKSVPSESRLQINKKQFLRKASSSSVESDEDGRKRAQTVTEGGKLKIQKKSKK